MSVLPDAPVLGLPHLARELEALHRDRHRTRRSCVFGLLDGAGTSVTARIGDEQVAFRVREVRSELELRLQLDEDRGDDVVYVVPFARRLPRDLASHFAKGSLWWPRAEHQLPRRFGARSASPRFLGSRLAKLVRHEGGRDYVTTTSSPAATIDLDEAWLMFLQAHVGSEGALTASTLLQGALLDDATRGPRLLTLLEKVPDARAELEATLTRALGSAASIVLGGWLDGRADLVAAAALVGEAVRETLGATGSNDRKFVLGVVEAGIQATPGHPLKRLLSTTEGPSTEALSQALLALAALLPLTWATFTKRRPQDAVALLGLASQLFSTEDARALATSSDRLPFVFAARKKRLGELLVSQAETPSSSTLAAILAQGLATLRHERSTESLAELVGMAQRLSAFLLLDAPALSEEPAAEVAALARFQVEHGAFVDWARHALRGQDGGDLMPGVVAVLARADAVVDGLHARFARAYARLVVHKGGRKNLKSVVAIEEALATGALHVLASQPDVRFLVLCMDGMSWANLVELWQRPQSHLSSFTPLVPCSSSGDVPTPVVAMVPTVTSVSRTALFLGRELAAGESLDTTKDGDRLTRHPSLSTSTEPPTLWMKKDLVAPAGQLHADLRKLIAGKAAVVGVVVNAIDDQLKGSAQLRAALSVSAIPVLSALLDAAEVAGRAVVLCSDHGNVPAQRFGTTVPVAKGADGGARWRWLPEGHSPRADEVVVPGGALPQPPGMSGAAVALDETVTYGAQRHAGEHGGLTLSEAIAPFLVLAPAAVVGDLVDERKLFRLARVTAPPWWSGQTSTTPTTPTKPMLVAQPIASTPTGELFPELSPAVDVVSAVLGSKLFKAMSEGKKREDVDKVRRGLVALVQGGGRLGRDAFAKAVGVTLPSRIPGYVGTMAGFLNVEQESVVVMDARQTLVELDVALLTRLFVDEKKQ
jgi:hypothetical protein